MSWNSRWGPYTENYIDFKDMKAGNVLEFKMGPEPSGGMSK